MSDYDRMKICNAAERLDRDPGRVRAWIEGYKAGIERNASWHNGTQVVGSMRTELRAALGRIDRIAEGLALAPEDGAS